MRLWNAGGDVVGVVVVVVVLRFLLGVTGAVAGAEVRARVWLSLLPRVRCRLGSRGEVVRLRATLGEALRLRVALGEIWRCWGGAMEKEAEEDDNDRDWDWDWDWVFVC